MSNAQSYNSLVKLVVGVVLLMIILSVVGSSVVTIDAGHVGVVKTFGAIQDKALPEGLHFKKPIMDKVVQIDTRLTFTDGQATAASKDLQMVSTNVTTQYSLVGVMAPKTVQQVGDRKKIAVSVIEPAIQESVKAVTAKFTAVELVTLREEVKMQIHDAIVNFIKVTLTDKGVNGAVKIANVAITDFDFSPEFNRAIELKVRAEQEALQAKNEKLKRVTQAEASAAEVELEAEAKALQIAAESKARAAAIEREAAALRGNPELIQLRMIERWDGQLPRFNGGKVIPMLDMGSFDKEAAKKAAMQ